MTDRTPQTQQGTLMLCRICWEGERSAGIARLRERAEAKGVTLRLVNCMAACEDGPSAAILAPRAWTYLLGHLSAEDGPALVWGAGALAASDDGLLPWKGRPARYREIIRGRIPPDPVE